jgi:hypothetical protein
LSPQIENSQEQIHDRGTSLKAPAVAGASYLLTRLFVIL